MSRATSHRRVMPQSAASTVARIAGLAACAVILLLAPGCTVEQPRPVIKTPYTSIPHDPNLPPFLHGTLADRTVLANNTPYPVSAYGLVGQLRGTGDCTAPSIVRQYMLNELAKRGYGDPLIGYGNITPAQVLKDKNYAIVVVQGQIPPGARKDDFIDVSVDCLPNNETQTLAHGVLFQTELKQAGANMENPTGAVNPFVRVKASPILVNPGYALMSGLPTGAAKESLRRGVVMGMGRVMQDRPIFLQLRDPSLQTARQIENRIQNRFQDMSSLVNHEERVVQAQDMGVISLYPPSSFHGDWEHFVGICQHLWLEDSADFNVRKAKMLVEEAQKPDAPLEDISYCWEALGRDALPFIQPLLTSKQPDVSFAAARAAAFIGDPTGSAEATLIHIAQTPLHPFRISAVQALGEMPASSALNHKLRDLLDSDQATVRIEAYKVLARNHDSSIYTTIIHPDNEPLNEKFVMDIVPSDGPPLIYASRQGVPRIAIIGKTPELRLPITYSVLDNQLTISSPPTGKAVTLYYREASRRWVKDDRGLPDPVKVICPPDAAELIARLGGAGPREDGHLNLTYGEVVAIVQNLTDAQQFGAEERGKSYDAAFVLEEPPRLQNVITKAPVIGEAVAPSVKSEDTGGNPRLPAPSANRTVGTGPMPAIGPTPTASRATP